MESLRRVSFVHKVATANDDAVLHGDAHPLQTIVRDRHIHGWLYLYVYVIRYCTVVTSVILPDESVVTP
jgi:hypothetical protein